VLDKVAGEGKWGRSMPAGHAQGIAFHAEYRSCTACLVEIDATDPDRPRVTKATIAADVGRPINPRGLESQLLGGLTDAIGTTLRAGLHIDAGLPLEGSYSQFHYTRQADSPRDVTIFVMPANGEPGGAGELGVPAAVGAVANAYAYARATGRKPRSFPITFPVTSHPSPAEEPDMPNYTFQLNGETVTVDAPADLPLLWTLRDELGVTGPEYGCGIDVCTARTSHLDGEAVNPCVVPTSEARNPTDADIDAIENVCRCGSHSASARRSRPPRRGCDRGDGLGSDRTRPSLHPYRHSGSPSARRGFPGTALERPRQCGTASSPGIWRAARWWAADGCSPGSVPRTMSPSHRRVLREARRR
jgi:hypothetical protein